MQRLLRPASCTLQAGFTLIELLAVCAIMVIIAGLVMTNQAKFGGHVLLQNFTYDVALSIRQAQVYGIAVRSSGTGANPFDDAYGINILSGATSYLLFADSSSPVNGMYGAGDTVRERMDIKRGYRVVKLCVPETLSNPSDVTSCTGISELNIVFVRPEPDAWISWRTITGTVLQCLPTRANCGNSARIVLQSPEGERMSVKVFKSGQIAVDQSIDN